MVMLEGALWHSRLVYLTTRPAGVVLLAKCATASKYTGGIEEALEELSPSTWTVFLFFLTALFCLGIIFPWCLYIEGSPPPKNMRRYLLAAVFVISCFELGLCVGGVLHWWMAPVLALTNFWGSLDAVLRFPVVHDLDTWFAAKQILLLAGKVCLYAFGFVDISASKVILFGTLLGNIITLPLVYFLALPLDQAPPEQMASAYGVSDIDVAVLVLRFFTNSHERQNHLLALRRCSRTVLVELARCLPLVGHVLAYFDPSIRQTLLRKQEI